MRPALLAPTVFLVVFVTFFGAILLVRWLRIVRSDRQIRKWEKAKKAAVWDKFTISDGEKVHVWIRRVASIKGRTEVIEEVHIGSAHVTSPSLQDDVLDLHAKAFEKVVVLNSF